MHQNILVSLDSWCDHPRPGEVQQARNFKWSCSLGNLPQSDGLLQNKASCTSPTIMHSTVYVYLQYKDYFKAIASKAEAALS